MCVPEAPDLEGEETVEGKPGSEGRLIEQSTKLRPKSTQRPIIKVNISQPPSDVCALSHLDNNGSPSGHYNKYTEANKCLNTRVGFCYAFQNQAWYLKLSFLSGVA